MTAVGHQARVAADGAPGRGPVLAGGDPVDERAALGVDADGALGGAREAVGADELAFDLDEVERRAGAGPGVEEAGVHRRDGALGGADAARADAAVAAVGADRHRGIGEVDVERVDRLAATGVVRVDLLLPEDARRDEVGLPGVEHGVLEGDAVGAGLVAARRDVGVDDEPVAAGREVGLEAGVGPGEAGHRGRRGGRRVRGEEVQVDVDAVGLVDLGDELARGDEVEDVDALGAGLVGAGGAGVAIEEIRGRGGRVVVDDEGKARDRDGVGGGAGGGIGAVGGGGSGVVCSRGRIVSDVVCSRGRIVGGVWRRVGGCVRRGDRIAIREDVGDRVELERVDSSVGVGGRIRLAPDVGHIGAAVCVDLAGGRVAGRGWACDAVPLCPGGAVAGGEGAGHDKPPHEARDEPGRELQQRAGEVAAASVCSVTGPPRRCGVPTYTSLLGGRGSLHPLRLAHFPAAWHHDSS